MKKTEFVELWGDSVKHPIPLGVDQGWLLYKQMKDQIFKSKEVKAYSEATLAKIVTEMAKELMNLNLKDQGKELIFKNLECAGDPKALARVILEHAKDTHENVLIFEKILARKLEKIISVIDGNTSVKDIDTASIRKYIINNPNILKDLFPSLVEEE